METIELRSPAFNDHAPIPARHSHDGEDLPPALEWSGVPEGTAELVVLCEDPDAPGGTFTHWTVACIDPSVFAMAEDQVLPGAVEGTNDFGDQGYGGPRPPVGDDAHRYFFRVVAVSEPLGLSPGFSPDELRHAMEGKELGRGTLVGIYQR
jgi:Raf kinase inhibitor-like YbhB/YbcL family protein